MSKSQGSNTYIDAKAFVYFPLQFFACQQKLHCLLFSLGDKHKVDSNLVLEPWFRQDIINKGNFYRSVTADNMKTGQLDHSIIYITPRAQPC